MDSAESVEIKTYAVGVTAVIEDEDIERASSTIAVTAVTKTPSNWRKPYQFWLASLSLWLIVLLVTLDATALAVAIPSMTVQLNGTTIEAFWASIAFMLAVAVVQPIYVTVSDVLGRRIPLFAGLALFSTGAVVFALAQNMRTAIAGRVLQGLGGGGLDVLSEVIVTDMTTLKERPLWIGLLTVPMAIGSILGPVIGALFSEYASWRWLGWYNLPFVAVAAPCAFLFLKLKPVEDSLRTKLKKLDWTGMALFAAGAVLFALPLSWAPAIYPWSSWRTLVPFVLGIALLVGFAVWEKYPAQPCIPHRIMGNTTAQVTLVGGFIHGAIIYGVLLYLPLYFQAVFRETPLQAAVSVLPMCVTVVIVSGIAALAVEQTRRYRWSIWMGWILLAVGMGLISLWKRDTSLAASVSFQIITGFGLGSLFTVPTIAMQASAPTVDDQGLAAGTLVSFRLFGGLVGMACGATAFNSVFGSVIYQVGALPRDVAALADPAMAIGFIPHLRNVSVPGSLLDRIVDAYAGSLRVIWWILAGFAVVGALVSLGMKEISLENEEVGRQNWENKEE
ncbi:MFS general substrate transporter [Paraphaeosphaeria sporulosa]|uniref:MFS general substrate transporter n=1 Tax=Paraphaeosphaeria sporulosa TaxID=1460663 RepID=A0A177D095_9PLEO|nr:MFS general substrate transporter [Paraphaeosphaeria sporulosa]OAG12788.1 MFS general substrate transporter [Paraphaeosphaeria sporulosa]